MVIRLISVSDQLNLEEFHDIFQTVSGWSGEDVFRRWYPKLRTQAA
jgi:hypothetical protein